jgi:hypothetical protein
VVVDKKTTYDIIALLLLLLLLLVFLELFLVAVVSTSSFEYLVRTQRMVL